MNNTNYFVLLKCFNYDVLNILFLSEVQFSSLLSFSLISVSSFFYSFIMLLLLVIFCYTKTLLPDHGIYFSEFPWKFTLFVFKIHEETQKETACE